MRWMVFIYNFTFSSVKFCASSIAAGRMEMGKRLFNGLRCAPNSVGFTMSRCTILRIGPVMEAASLNSARVASSQPPKSPYKNIKTGKLGSTPIKKMLMLVIWSPFQMKAEIRSISRECNYVN